MGIDDPARRGARFERFHEKRKERFYEKRKERFHKKRKHRVWDREGSDDDARKAHAGSRKGIELVGDAPQEGEEEAFDEVDEVVVSESKAPPPSVGDEPADGPSEADEPLCPPVPASGEPAPVLFSLPD